MMPAKIVTLLFQHVYLFWEFISKQLRKLCKSAIWADLEEYLGEIVGHSLRRGLLVVELIVHGVALIGHLS